MDNSNKRNYKLEYYYKHHEEIKEKMRNYYYSNRNKTHRWGIIAPRWRPSAKGERPTMCHRRPAPPMGSASAVGYL